MPASLNYFANRSIIMGMGLIWNIFFFQNDRPKYCVIVDPGLILSFCLAQLQNTSQSRVGCSTYRIYDFSYVTSYLLHIKKEAAASEREYAEQLYHK